MPISYVVVEKVDPRDITAPRKFFAQAKSNGDTDLRELSKIINDISTVSSIDILGALEGLIQVIPEELSKGKIVRLGDFGTFFTTINGQGAENKDDFNNSLIKKTSIKFRPGKLIKEILDNVKYKKVNN